MRRAMSKKKGSVMEKERQNFVYGNGEEGVKGCIANGIDEKTANHIYDEMIDFAKYAFNKMCIRDRGNRGGRTSDRIWRRTAD